MNTMVLAIRMAGVIQLAIIAANLPLPGKLQVRKHLATVPRFIRQIFYVHWIYIVLVLGLFSALCFGFPTELAGASSLGRFLSVFLAVFWLSRLVLQGVYYDREVRRANRIMDGFYLLALTILIIVFSAAAGLGGGYGFRS
jgi:hypothetical protein